MKTQKKLVIYIPQTEKMTTDFLLEFNQLIQKKFPATKIICFFTLYDTDQKLLICPFNEQLSDSAKENIEFYFDEMISKL